MLLITLLMGVIQVLAGVFRLGAFGRYVSQGVLVGFTLGAATLIFSDQIRNVLGVPVESSTRLVETFENLVPKLAMTTRERSPSRSPPGRSCSAARGSRESSRVR